MMNVGHRKDEDEIELWGISAKQKKGPKLAAPGIALASLKRDDKAEQLRELECLMSPRLPVAPSTKLVHLVVTSIYPYMARHVTVNEREVNSSSS
jgi:hypothetical protein